MNATLPAHALSLRYDRVKEALGSVLPHRTLSRGLSICSGLAHLHIARSLIICELFVSYPCAQQGVPYASIPITQI